MYETLELLDVENRQRIYPLSAYPHLRDRFVVPILHIEFESLAQHWPIVWVRRGESFEPSAVLGFAAARPMFERLVTAPPDAVPLLLKAFPLALGPSGTDGGARILLNAAPEGIDESLGEPAFLPAGELSPAAVKRTDILWLFAAEREATEAMTRRLVECGALEIWKLSLVFSDDVVDNTEFHVVASHFLTDPRYVELAREFGPAFVSAVEHHVLSRLRIQALADEMSA